MVVLYFCLTFCKLMNSIRLIISPGEWTWNSHWPFQHNGPPLFPVISSVNLQKNSHNLARIASTCFSIVNSLTSFSKTFVHSAMFWVFRYLQPRMHIDKSTWPPLSLSLLLPQSWGIWTPVNYPKKLILFYNHCHSKFTMSFNKWKFTIPFCHWILTINKQQAII